MPEWEQQEQKSRQRVEDLEAQLEAFREQLARREAELEQQTQRAMDELTARRESAKRKQALDQRAQEIEREMRELSRQFEAKEKAAGQKLLRVKEELEGKSAPRRSEPVSYQSRFAFAQSKPSKRPALWKELYKIDKENCLPPGSA